MVGGVEDFGSSTPFKGAEGPAQPMDPSMRTWGKKKGWGGKKRGTTGEGNVRPAILGGGQAEESRFTTTDNLY